MGALPVWLIQYLWVATNATPVGYPLLALYMSMAGGAFVLLMGAVRATNGKTISICSEYLSQGHNIHDFGNYSEVDVAIAADGEATLPSLIEEVRRQSTGSAARQRAARGQAIAAAHKTIREAEIDTARYGWNNSPISVPRMVAELGRQIQNDDWAIVSGHQFTGQW